MRIVLYLLFIIAIACIANAQQATESSDAKSQTQSAVYIVGKVKKPARIPFDKSIYLIEAIRQAGGTTLREKQSRALITRRPAGCQFLTEILVDLRDILANRVEDIALQSNDVIEILLRKPKNKFPRSPRPCKPKEPVRMPLPIPNLE